MRTRSRAPPTEQGKDELCWFLPQGRWHYSRLDIAAMESWNRQDQAPRKRYMKRSSSRRRWRLPARGLNSGRIERKPACVYFPAPRLQEISLHVKAQRLPAERLLFFEDGFY